MSEDAAPSSLLERVRHYASTEPSRLALVEPNRSMWTYGELAEHLEQLATQLRALGVGPGRRVALDLPRGAGFVVAMLASWAAGGSWLPLPRGWPELRRLDALTRAKPLVRIGPGSNETSPSAQVDSKRRSFHAPMSKATFALEAFSDAAPTFAGGEAYVLFTSGSTGRPKGVRVGHRGLDLLWSTQVQAFALDREARVAWVLSPGFDASVSDIGTTLWSGATLVIADERLPAFGLAYFVAENAVTHVDFPAALLSVVSPWELGPQLRTVVVGGEPSPPEAMRRWAAGVRLVNVYGPTEATVCTSLCQVSSDWDAPRLGTPFEGLEYSVVEVPDVPADEGELWIHGDAVALGYLDDPELEGRRFLVDPRGRPTFRTGDRVGRRDGHRAGLRYVGRLDRMCKVRGQRVQPEETELQLLAMTEVQAANVSFTHGRLVAEVQLTHEALGQGALTAATLRGRLATKLPAAHVPEVIDVVGHIERTAGGKIARPPAPRLADSAELHWSDAGLATADVGHEGHAVPADLVVLLAIAREVLGHPSLSADETLDALGRTSLTTLELVVRAAAVGLTLSAERAAGAPTLRAMATSTRPATLSVDELRLRADQARLRGARLLEATRPELASALCESWPPTPGKPRRVLLTGATGFLGAATLRALLGHDLEVHCLVRATDVEAAERRLERALTPWSITSEHPTCRPPSSRPQANNPHVLLGDLALPWLGLEPETWSWCAREIDTILHLGAELPTTRSYAELEAANVDGTAAVLALTKLGRPKHLTYASSLAVFLAGGANAPGRRWNERDLPLDVGLVHGGYAQTKWVAEHLVAEHLHQSQHPSSAAIVRLGLLTPIDAHHVPRQSAILDWLRGLLTLGEVPPLPTEGWVDLTPVPFAAQALVTLALRRNTGTFHVALPPGARPLDLVAGLARQGRSLPSGRLTDAPRGREEAMVHWVSRMPPPTSCGHGPDLFLDHVAIDVEHTRMVLEGHGLHWPSVEEAVDGCVSAALGVGVHSAGGIS